MNGSSQLVILHGKNSPHAGSDRLDSTEVTFGRAPSCTLSYPHSSMVSTRHARLVLEGTEWWLEDQGSTNGTFLDGTPIEARTIVRSGSQIRLGRSGGPQFQVVYEERGELLTVDAVPAATMAQSAPTGKDSGIFVSGASPQGPGPGGAKTIPATLVGSNEASPVAPPLSRAPGEQRGVGLLTLDRILTSRSRSLASRLTAIFSVVLLVAVGGVYFAASSAPEVVGWSSLNDYAGSVYVVLTCDANGNQRSFGTAWSVADGYLATNAHVAEEFETALARGDTLIARPGIVDGFGATERDLRIVGAVLHPDYAPFEALISDHRTLDPTTGSLSVPHRNPFDVALFEVHVDDFEKQGRTPHLPIATDDDLASLSAGSAIGFLGYPMENSTSFNATVPEPQRKVSEVGRVTDCIGRSLAAAEAVPLAVVHVNVSNLGGASGSPYFGECGRVVAVNNSGEYLFTDAETRIGINDTSFGPTANQVGLLLAAEGALPNGASHRAPRLDDYRDNLIAYAQSCRELLCDKVAPHYFGPEEAWEIIADQKIELRPAKSGPKLSGVARLGFHARGKYSYVLLARDPGGLSIFDAPPSPNFLIFAAELVAPELTIHLEPLEELAERERESSGSSVRVIVLRRRA